MLIVSSQEISAFLNSYKFFPCSVDSHGLLLYHEYNNPPLRKGGYEDDN